MTDRTITLTPTEAEKFKALAVGESMWLVREGVHWEPRVHYPTPRPPAEFVQACAPCGSDYHAFPEGTYPGEYCHLCRIELVAICDTCDGQSGSMYGGSWGGCEPCNASGISRLGWGYAVGQPLPIVPFSTDHDDMPHICVDERPDSWLLLYPGSIEPLCGDNDHRRPRPLRRPCWPRRQVGTTGAGDAVSQFEQIIRDAIHDDNDWPGILSRLVDPDDIEDRMARAVLDTDEMGAIQAALRDMATSLAIGCNDDINHGASVKGGTRGWLTFHLPDGMDHVIDWALGQVSDG